MKCIKGYPPNFIKLRAAFPFIAGNRFIIFAYGDRVYSPGVTTLPPCCTGMWQTSKERKRIFAHESRRKIPPASRNVRNDVCDVDDRK